MVERPESVLKTAVVVSDQLGGHAVQNGELNSGELGGKQEQAHDETCFGNLEVFLC